VLRTIAKLPRAVFWLNHYTYVVVAVLIMITAAVLLGVDGFTWVDVILMGAIVGLAVVIQRAARPVQSADVPDQLEMLEAQLANSDRLTLLAFESEYCPTCMVTNPMLLKLEESGDPALRVMRLSIQHEPGLSLFKKFDGRMTPTFVLLDRRGNVLMDWLLTLPVNRVLFEVKQAVR